jgi:hypothetical protein
LNFKGNTDSKFAADAGFLCRKAPVNNCLALGHDEMEILYSVLKNKILQRPFQYIFIVLVGKIFSVSVCTFRFCRVVDVIVRLFKILTT